MHPAGESVVSAERNTKIAQRCLSCWSQRGACTEDRRSCFNEWIFLCCFNRTSPHVSFPSVSAQFVVIPTRRATAVAFQSFTSHLLGDAGSPYLIGLVRVAEKQLCALIRVLMVVEGDRITPPGSQFPATAPYIYTMCRQQFSAYLKWAKCKVLLAHVSGGPVSTVVISPPACHWYF